MYVCEVCEVYKQRGIYHRMHHIRNTVNKTAYPTRDIYRTRRNFRGLNISWGGIFVVQGTHENLLPTKFCRALSFEL